MPSPATTSPFYAVTTTGIYCRTGCPSRRPRPENVRHFVSPASAEAAGFRPCLRCRPRDLSPPNVARIAAAVTQLTTAPTEPSLSDLATSAGLSRFHFLRLFKSATGLTPKQYARAHRINRLRAELKSSPTVTAATYRAGFNSPSRAHAAASGHLGMTPTAYRNGAEGIPIRYALTRTSLDWLLVAATPRGVCFIALADSRQELADALRAEFPRAKLCKGDPQFDAWAQSAATLVDFPSTSPNLPLDPHGTAFQHLVWRALQRIPPGQTTTYADLAASLGKPTATRAVARACATNPVALAIPCHRVIARDGALRGYRWGLKRKRALLDRERQNREHEESSRIDHESPRIHSKTDS